MQTMSNLEAKGIQDTLLELADLQCVYDDIELPCTVCFEKGLRCTAADKIWGKKRESRQLEIEKRNEQSMTEQRGDILSNDDEIIEIIPRQFPTPNEEMLTPVEAMYIQYFHEVIVDYYLSAYQAQNFVMLPRFRPNMSSRAVRYAVMLLSLQDLGVHRPGLEEYKYKDLYLRST